MIFGTMLAGEKRYRPHPNIVAPQPEVFLTKEQCESFWHDGFLSLPQITSADDLARIRTLYDQMFEERAGWHDGNYFDLVGLGNDPDKFKIQHLQRITDYCPDLLATRYFCNATCVAGQLLGGSVKHLYDIAISKPPCSDAATPWHQDAAFLAETSYFETLVFWVPLQPVDSSNGCMNFIPGSHRGPLFTHRSPGGDTRVNGLEAVGIDKSGAVACPLPAGGATIHHFRTLHGTGGNNTAGLRRALTFGFGIRRSKPTIVGPFDWLMAKDHFEFHHGARSGPMHWIKKRASPYITRLMVGLNGN
jgi:hypothetical protein